MKEFEAKVRLNEEDGGKTGELDIMSKPPYDKGYFNGVTYGIKFKDPVFEAERSTGVKKMRKCPLLGVYVEETDVWDKELGYLRTLKNPVAHDCMGKLCINYEDGYCTWYKRDTYDVVEEGDEK